MKRFAVVLSLLVLCVLVAGVAGAEKSDAEMIAEAKSAAPPVITEDATFKTLDGKLLRQGSSDWTCYPGVEVIGPMCNQTPWDNLISAVVNKQPIDVKEFSVSYMLAGEGEAIGASNTDPFASEPTDDNDWIKEGPHLMILVPDPAIFEGMSTDPNDPVYVMWKGTPYAHIMVKIAEDE